MKSSKLRWPVAMGLALMFGTFAGAAESAPAGGAPTPGDVSRDQRETSDARFKKQDERKAEAQKLRSEGKYDRAIKMLEDVLGELELESGAVRSDIVASRKREFNTMLLEIRGEYGAQLLTQARLAAADKRYEEAKTLAAGVSVIDNRLKSKADALITYCSDMIRNDEVVASRSLQAAAPEREAKLKKIHQLLNEAQTFYNAKRFGDALNRVEDAYVLDPYNIDVIALAGNVYKQIYTYGYHRHMADAQGMNAYAKWQWAEPTFTRAQTIDRTTPGLVRGASGQNVEDRLDRIIIKNINFEEADIRTVIRNIKALSVAADPEKRGIEINLGLTQQQTEDMPPLTFDFTNIAMSNLLRYICRMTNLKYRTDSDGSITIGREVDDMMRRNFVVRGNLIKNVVDEIGTSATTVAAGDEGAPVDEAGAAAGGEGVSNKLNEMTASDSAKTQGRLWASPTALMAYFNKRNITFPEGSSISYNLKRRELVVRNTAKNLQDMEALINQYDMLNKLVMIEIKAIEITEQDLQELGFHWSLDMLGSNMDGRGNLIDSSSSGWAFGQGSNTNSYANSSSPLQSVRQGVIGTNSAVISDLNIFPMLFGSQQPFGSDTALNIGLTVNALSQNTRTETLSAPKLITQDGQTAEIQMVRRYYFPQSWDTMEVETETSDNSSRVTITPPVPSFSDGGDPIGIIFSATPKVLDDGHTIQLHVNPQITAYLGPDEWTVKIYGQYSGGTSVVDGVLQENEPEEYDYVFTVWRPIISRRQIDTTVNVYDGQTIVLGGVVESTNLGRTDKLPILGDLPLIGRFFQSQSDNVTRTNLLIFVTARLMKNDGVPISPSIANGAPDFNR